VFVYIAQVGKYYTAQIGQYRLDQNVVLQPVDLPVQIAAGSSADFIASHPGGRFLYVVRSIKRDILKYTVDRTTGALSPQPTVTTVPFAMNPVLLKVHPNGKWLYVLDTAPGAVLQFTIDPKTGDILSHGQPLLTVENSQSVALEFNPDGHFAYVLNKEENSLVVYSVTEQGKFEPVASGVVATGALPTSMAIHPSGLFAYTANSYDRNISQYVVDPHTGILYPNPIAPLIATPSRPLAIVVEPSGRFAYVSCPDPPEETIRQYTIGSDGTLHPSASQLGLRAKASSMLAAEPGGKFLITGGDEKDGQIARPINPRTGALGDDGARLVGPETLGSSIAFVPSRLNLHISDSRWQQGLWREARKQFSHRFTPVGRMTASRKCHSATLLNDGRVLIVGGAGKTAELFDPAAGRFSPISDMTVDRACPSTMLLPDGEVLIVGEEDQGTEKSSVEAFDPKSGAFHTRGTLRNVCSGRQAILLKDGRVLVFGGQDSQAQALSYQFVSRGMPPPCPAELFDPSSGISMRVTTRGTLRDACSWRQAIVLKDGRVLMYGGQAASDGRLASGPPRPCPPELFDPSSGESVVGGFLPPTVGGSIPVFGLPYGQINALGDGKILVTSGGCSSFAGPPPSKEAWLYNPGSGKSIPTGTMNYDHCADPTVLLRDGRLLIPAGSEASAEIYDPASGRFSSLGKMTSERSHYSITLLKDGKVLVVGGEYRSSAETFDPASGTFTPAGSMTRSFSVFSATLLNNGTVLLAGGWRDGVLVNLAEIYRP
jgi:6-phosphogluconolactonase (cycloisomerase 2 family)